MHVFSRLKATFEQSNLYKNDIKSHHKIKSISTNFRMAVKVKWQKIGELIVLYEAISLSSYKKYLHKYCILRK